MHRLFGRAKETPAATPAPSLGDHIAKLEGKGVDLEAKIADCDRQLVAIKAQLAKCKTAAQQAPHKQRAMAILKRKKMYEQQRDGMLTRAMNMEQTQFAIDGMKDAKEHVAVMKAGVADMKGILKELDLGEIEDMTDDMADMMADQEEINELLGRSFGVSDTVDEADLDAELAGLDMELGMGEATPATGAAVGGAVAAPAGDDGLAAYLAPSLTPAAAAPAAPVAAGGSGSGGGGSGMAFPAVPTGALPASKTPVVMGAAARF